MCFGSTVSAPQEVATQASQITPQQNYPDANMSGQQAMANQRRKSALAGVYGSQFGNTAIGLNAPASTTRNLLG